MKILSASSAYSYGLSNAAQGPKKPETKPVSSPVNFCGQSSEPVFRAFNPAQEKIDRENYRKEFMDKIFIEKTDKSGNPVLDKTGKPKTILDPAIKAVLDETVFEFEGPGGEKFSGTIKEAMEKFIVFDDTNMPGSYSGLLHGCSQESMQDILKNGPDMRKTSRCAFGPGMYFALSEGDAHDYSSAKLKADIKKTSGKNGESGKFVRLKGAFFDKIANNAVSNFVSELAGIDPQSIYIYPAGQPYYISQVKQEIPRRLLDEYCRDILVNDFGIDAAYGADARYHSCVVVFNPDSIKNACNYNEDNNRHDYYYRY